MSLGTVKVPTLAQLSEVAAELGLSFSEADLAAHLEALRPSFEGYNILDRMPDELPPIAYPRRPGRRPAPEENPHGAWYVKTEVPGAASGKLKGKKIALKDNICLAGVPMMNGASTMEGYVPDLDATVATRILDAGGTIVGKTVCEYFCFSGGSHTSATGPVHNPHRTGYSAGGSSSGSAAVVAAGEVPMALGGDQGGSIRIPAAFCGIYGLKPTHGLVPYTGIMPIELTLDHTGPMTATVEDNALLLEVLAGPDGLDPRQYGAQPNPYRESLGRGVKGLRIAVVEEGFGHSQSMPHVDPDAPRRLGNLVGGRGGGRADADDAGQWLRLQLAGALRHFDAGFPQLVAKPGGRIVGHPQKHDAARALHGDALPRPLLRQGAEPRAPVAPGL